MKVTVCELPSTMEAFEREWPRLVEHVARHRSSLVLLPEMPFAEWFGGSAVFDAARWARATQAHDRWTTRVAELAPARVAFSRPVDDSGGRYNEGVLVDGTTTHRLHRKHYLPNEFPVWEASWYRRSDGTFRAANIGETSLGFLICTELWFFERARDYATQNVDVLLTPRKTDESTLDRWLVAGRAAAITAGAFSLSSNSRSTTDGFGFGGGGWILDPQGTILAMTTKEEPFATREISLEDARSAKRTYPRNIPR